MPKFFVMSDIHIDNALSYGIDGDDLFKMYMLTINKVSDHKERVWLLAGDVTSFGDYTKDNYNILKKLCAEFKHTFMVFGNHDYASALEVPDVVKKCKQYARKIPNLTILDGRVVEYEGVTIGGCIGWYTKFDKLSMHFSELVSWDNWYDGYCWNYLNHDVHAISKREVGKMRKVLKRKPDIMITHVAHEVLNTNPKYKNNDSNKFFFYDDADFDFSGVKYLINGHVHHSDVQNVGDMKVLCNPFGYLAEDPLDVHNKAITDFLFEV